MAVTSSRRASVLGMAILMLSLSACSVPIRPPSAADAIPAPPPGAAGTPGQPSHSQPHTLAEIIQTHAEAPPAPPQKSPLQALLPGQLLLEANGREEPPLDAWDRLRHDVDLSVEDHRNYYSWSNLGLVALGLAAVAPVANTTADEHLRRWYQKRVQSAPLNRVADVGNYAGQLWVAVPLALEGAALAGLVPKGYDTDGGLWEWSNRSLRAIAVGFPPVLAEYVLLGSSRPDRGHHAWQPFQDIHGVSGHTFIGAVPFLTGAAMTDNPWIKYPLILGSFVTGWARFHEDRHYFSQIALGWWMAYLAVRSVNETQASRVTVVPGVTPDGPGMALEVRY